MSTCSGSKRPRPTSPKRRNSPSACMPIFPASCWLTTARPHSTGKRSSIGATIAKFQRELGAMGYKFQFVTLAGFHALNYSMFKLAHGYRDRGMAAYSELQEAEFAAEADGYSRDQTSTRGRHRIFRRCRTGHRGWGKLDRGSARLDRRRAVSLKVTPPPAASAALTDSRLAALCAEEARNAFRDYESALRRDHATSARSFSGARLARQP